MQAIILAAGMGKRLKELTQNNTKCMVKVNGVTLIDRMLHQIERCGLTNVTVVVGYESYKLMDYIHSLGIRIPISFINNPIYDKTNNIYSLALAKERLCTDDTILFESDLIFEDSVLYELINDPRETLALVDKYEAWMDGTCVKIAPDDSIEAFIPGKKITYEEVDQYYKTVNNYKFSKHFSTTHYVPFLEAYQKALGENEYYEQVLRVITMLDDSEIKAKRLTGQRWYEIDDIQDLDIAESIFAPNEDERVDLLQRRYGGYWRYPKMLDYCYLVNPYFPPIRMVNEMKSSFGILLRNYPSGMSVNSLLAAKNFNVHQDNIVVGNGAAELIKSFMGRFGGKTGFIRPTFDEYLNRYDSDNSVVFTPQNNDYSYTADDIISFFAEHPVETLIIINPDNPSGNYLDKGEIQKVLNWGEKHSTRVLIDESFVDFAEELDASLLNQETLSSHPFLYVMKSISKSYGVPGLRLGVLASGDTETIKIIKKDVAIWNINSFAEFYMQIVEKYKNDYEQAIEKFKLERKHFFERLKQLKGIRVVPSQANYFMIELGYEMSAKTLLKRMLIKHNILIKELTSKTNGRNFMRIAIRSREDNDVFVAALAFELEQLLSSERCK